MTGNEMQNLRRSLGLTQEEFAQSIRSTQTRISRFERSTKPIPEEIAYTIRFMAAEREAIALATEHGKQAETLDGALKAIAQLLEKKR